MSITGRSLVCALAWVAACGDDSGDSGRGSNAGSGGATIITISDSGTAHSDSATPNDAGTARVDAASPADASLPAPTTSDDGGADSDGGEVDLHALRTDVQRNCRETSACSMMEGGIEECVSVTLGFLVGAPESFRRNFERLAAACRDVEGCEYVQCANDAAAGGAGP